MIDQNAHRCPKYPLEPLFRALLTSTPTFDLGSIDLVTDRSNLRKLLRFAANEGGEPFMITVQRLGKTTLFTRNEPQSSERITGFRGFGHEFEKAYTTWPTGMENSTSHHRIVQYKLCGIQCIVRFEVDACTHAGPVDDDPSPDEDDGLSSLLGSVTIEPKSDVSDPGTVHVVKGGTLVPQSSVLEIKTRAATRGLSIADVMPQLWFSDTQALAVGYHRRGRFGTVIPMRLETGELETWECNNAINLGKLVALIGIIIKEMEKADGGRCVIQGLRNGTLVIKKSTTLGDCLPADLKAKFL